MVKYHIITYKKQIENMAKNNNNLHTAKRAKNDEFYTQLVDIENELRFYKNHFRGKVVYCNCDGFLTEEKSNFFVYFSLNYEFLGLKGLICTKYNPNGKGKKYEYYGDLNGNNYPDEEEIFTSDLEGDGDFRSEECIELLKKCDIVCTNPPFSLFREYVAQLVQYDKKFLIIGNMNATTYKEIFPLIRDNKLWYGPSISSGDREFMVPESYPIEAAGWRIDEKGKKYIRVKGVRWFTNLDHGRRHEPLPLLTMEDNIIYSKHKEIKGKQYVHYENYDAIDVPYSDAIPSDYEGLMGVPISFLDKYCPEQFEIIGNEYDLNLSKGRGYVNGKRCYGRVFIRKK